MINHTIWIVWRKWNFHKLVQQKRQCPLYIAQLRLENINLLFLKHLYLGAHNPFDGAWLLFVPYDETHVL